MRWMMTAHSVGTTAARFSPLPTARSTSSKRRLTSTTTDIWAQKTTVRLSRVTSLRSLRSGRAGVLLVVVATLAASGRGSNLVPVRGKVQHDGAALREGKIVFTPVGGGKTAFGEIQSNGEFQLTTDSSGGATPGTYLVRIIE